MSMNENHINMMNIKIENKKKLSQLIQILKKYIEHGLHQNLSMKKIT